MSLLFYISPTHKSQKTGPHPHHYGLHSESIAGASVAIVVDELSSLTDNVLNGYGEDGPSPNSPSRVKSPLLMIPVPRALVLFPTETARSL